MNLLTAIVVPITRNQLFELETLFLIWSLWDEINYARKKNVKLIISFDCDENEYLVNSIKKLYYKYEIYNIFNNLSFIFTNIPDKDNIYLKTNDCKLNYFPELGFVSGPNIQFFKTIKKLKNEKYILLNETDCIPCRADWLNNIYNNIFWSEPFWIKGSSYKGNDKINSDINNHINGNAIYFCGDPLFQAFINEWENGLKEAVKTRKFLAYDVFLELNKQAMINSNDSNQLKKIRLLAKNFVYTDMILNVSGKTDSISLINDDQFKLLLKKASLIHGKGFVSYNLYLLTNKIATLNSTSIDRKIEAADDFLKKYFELQHHDNNLIKSIKENIYNRTKCYSSIKNGLVLKKISKTYETNDFEKNVTFNEENLIFLLGNPRSGTTLFQKLLSTSKSIATCGEPWIQLYFLGNLDTNLVESKFDSNLMNNAIYQAEIECGIPGHFDKIIKQASLDYYYGILQKEKPKAIYFLDKTPRYAMIAHNILIQYPKSYYIILKRNPFDIASSVISSWVKSFDVFINSKRLRYDFEIGIKNLVEIIKSPPAKHVIVTYNDLTENTSKIFSNVSKLIGISKDEFNINYSTNTKKYSFGDSKKVDFLSKPKVNKDSWRNAFKSKSDYNNLIKYLEQTLTKEELSIMDYDPHIW